MADRRGFIDSAVNQYGLTSNQLNSALQEAGFEKLNKIESTLIDSGKWGTTLGERAKEGVKDITSGLSTLISNTALHPIATAKEAGKYLYENSLPEIIGDFYDVAARPIQLDSESLGRNYAEGGIKGIGEGVVAGAITNPTDALILSAPVWGKGLAKGVKAIAKNDKLPMPKFIKDSLRGAVAEGGREVNQILRDSKLVSAPKIEKLRATNINIQNAKTEDLAQAVRNVELGTTEGTAEQIALTNQLKDMTAKIDEMMVNAGYSPDLSRTETINQYVTRFFQEQGKDIPVSQIEKINNKPKLLEKYGITQEELNQALANGDKLYREGFIRPIKHHSTAESVREGYVSEAEKKLREPNAKMYGTQSYEDVAEGIKAGAYDNLIRTLEKAESSANALDQMAGVVGKTVKPEYTSKVTNRLRNLADKEYVDLTTDHIWNWMQKNEWKLPTLGLTKDDLKFYIRNGGKKFRMNGKTTVNETKIPHELFRLRGSGKRPFQWILDEEFETVNGKLPETVVKREMLKIPLADDEVIVSPKLLREKIGTSLVGNEQLNEPLKSLTRGLNKAEIEKYADDLYIYKKRDLEALQRAFNANGKQTNLGIFGETMGIGKTIALATPRYVIGNATTNFLMNPVTGTNIGHYAEALESFITKSDKIPEILKRTASYSGYLGDLLPIRSNMREIYTKLIKDLKEGDFTTKWKALNAITNTPIFKSANTIETLQRSAEYLNQAEKYAKQVGKTTEQVLKEAKANGGLNPTYRAISRKVDEILGDYSGKNYYSPEGLTALANVSMPFYRPFTQAPRQMFNAIKDYPLSTQLSAIIPSRYGKNISDVAKEDYGIEPYKSQGGAPVLAPDAKMPSRVLYNQYHPFSPVGEIVTEPFDVLSGNPFLGAIQNISSGKTRYGETPLPPNTYKMGDGTLAVMDNNGNVAPYIPENHPMDNVKFRIAETLKALTPVGNLNSYILPAMALGLNQEYARPADTSLLGQVGDFTLPNIMEGATGRTRKGFNELVLPQLGFNYTDTYPERREDYTPTQRKGTTTKILKRQAKNERR